jgi:hypothetical protein
MTIGVLGMQGLGDNIFQRAFVKTLAQSEDVVLRTPWPQLYADLPRVRCIPSPTRLRTQLKNMLAQPHGAFVDWKPGRVARTVTVSYGHKALERGSVIRAMEACFGVPPSGWDLPARLMLGRWAPTGRPIAMVRPVTVRAEWLNIARNPLPEYVAHAAAQLMRTHHVISVADLEDGKEWLDGEAPPAHEYLHHGELTVESLLALVVAADVVVGGVGWIVPACIATGTPLFCILGGQGGHNAPSKITDPRMRLSHVRFAEPDHFCQCTDMRHGGCDKRITGFVDQWAAFQSERDDERAGGAQPDAGARAAAVAS